MISEDKNIEELFQKNQLNKVKHQEFLDACKDRSVDLIEKGYNHGEIIDTINEDIIAYKKQNGILTIDSSSTWGNHYWYFIVSTIINVFYVILYKNMFRDKDIFIWLILINILIVIFNCLILGINNSKKLKKHIEFGLYSLLMYAPLLLFKITTPTDFDPVFGILSKFGIIPLGWIVIKSIFSKKISVTEILTLVTYSFLITSVFVVDYFVVWLIVIFMTAILSLAVLINSTINIYKLTKNDMKLTAVKTLLLVVTGASLYVYIESFFDPSYSIQIFTICFILINLVLYVLYKSKSLIKSINIFWILFLLYIFTRFIKGVSLFKNEYNFVNVYQSIFIWIIPMITALIVLINRKNKNEKEIYNEREV